MAYAEYDAVVTADNPIIRYTFNTAVSNTGSLSITQSGNVPSRIPNGPMGSTYALMDGSTYVQCTNTTNYFGDKTWAVEAWFKTATTDAGDYKTIMRRSTSSSHMLFRVRGASLSLNPGLLEMYFGVPGAGVVNFYSNIRVDDGQWHHGMALSGVGAMLLFVDGQNVGSASMVAGGTHSNTNPLQIGRESSGTEYFVGGLDEVAVYDWAVGADVPPAHYNAAMAEGVLPFRGWGIQLK